MVTSHIMHRLVLVKQFYSHGLDHLERGTTVDRLIALLHFDNAAEMLLLCLGSLFNLKIRNKRFPEKINSINKHLESINVKPLLFHSEIIELHKARNQSQHSGEILAKESMDKHHSAIRSFIETALKQHFELNMDQLLRANLVQNTTLSQFLSAAECHLEKEEWKESINQSAEAFHFIETKVNEIFQRVSLPITRLNFLPTRMTSQIQGPPSIGISLDYYESSQFNQWTKEITNLANQNDADINRVIEWIQDLRYRLQRELIALILGVDYGQYLQFTIATPFISHYEKGTDRYHYSAGMKFTRGIAYFCYNFVLDLALKTEVEWNLDWQEGTLKPPTKKHPRQRSLKTLTSGSGDFKEVEDSEGFDE